ncbi:LysR family transcriptional regulator [Halomonas sp. KHS3]|uniref:LysR family transcriptional regulator n=1 Tax=Halomonas sp. KHS3 TaxID=866350 RepID=UPI00059AE542|nr:LysR family transcriptional regulator [Halomonas sp. KHS3]KIN16869.1 LysR family transcriptional regulator [Halomonas sp. KHS3]
MDKLTAMRTFRRVVELQSFSAAANDQRLSNGAVSKQVAELEASLGVTLLTRTTRRLSLTDAGRAYYERCACILDDIEETELALGVHQAIPRGSLKINCPMSLGLLHIAPLIPVFAERYPEINIELVMNDRRVALVEEGFDVALRAGDPLEDSSLIARRLQSIHRVLCASPGYLERFGEPTTPQALSEHKCLLYSLGAAPEVWSLGYAGQTIEQRVKATLTANSSIALREALLAGMGISLTPTFVVSADLKAGRLIEIMPTYRPPEQGLYILYPASRYLSPKVRCFVDFMVNQLGGTPPWG